MQALANCVCWHRHCVSSVKMKIAGWHGINPPFIPYAPALEALGINLQKMLMIHPKTHKDTLWALERAVKSGSCSSLLAWVDEKKLTLKDTQRLQVAAKQGRTPNLFISTTTCCRKSQHGIRAAYSTTCWKTGHCSIRHPQTQEAAGRCIIYSYPLHR